MSHLQTRWTDSFYFGEPLTPTYGRALLKWNKFSARKILQGQLMKEREIKKARNEQDRMRRESGSNQHVQKNGVIYKGTADDDDDDDDYYFRPVRPPEGYKDVLS
jgi:hypothetical protein